MTAQKQSRDNERRVMRIQLLIARNHHEGMRLTDIAKAVETTASTAYGTLTVMAEEGFVSACRARMTSGA